eukprot:12938329-Ditylum_brightwellii.AAC.1
MSFERGAVDASPKESNVQTCVHKYYGGTVTSGGKGSKEIYYSKFSTQRLMKLVQDSPDGSRPTPVTPEGNRFCITNLHVGLIWSMGGPQVSNSASNATASFLMALNKMLDTADGSINFKGTVAKDGRGAAMKNF